MTNVLHRNILVIKLGALGDVVLALGPFAAIRERHRDQNVLASRDRALLQQLLECGFRFDRNREQTA